MSEPWFELTRDPADPATLTTTLPGDHASFDGHFVSNPVLPGVAQLAMALDACAAAGIASRDHLRGVQNIKFMHPLLPGAQCVVSVRPGRAANAVDFQIASDGTPAASGTLLFA